MVSKFSNYADIYDLITGREFKKNETSKILQNEMKEFLGDDLVLSETERKNKKSINDISNKKKCSKKTCIYNAIRKGYCRRHYDLNQKKICKMCTEKRYKKKYCKNHFFKIKKCIAKDCENDIFNIKTMLCRAHYNMIKDKIE
jgi:hypothetical protein